MGTDHPSQHLDQTRSRKRHALAALGICVVATAATTAFGATRAVIANLDWTPFKDQRLGYMFVYPAKVFTMEAGDPTDPLKARTQKRSGQVFRSKDSKAYLQTVAFANVDGVAIGAYKAKVESTYRGGKIEYDRLAPEFFVVSGVRGKDTFYERVYFSCGGRVISAWSMTYPKAEGALYDRIVEEVARSWRPAESVQACARSPER